MHALARKGCFGCEHRCVFGVGLFVVQFHHWGTKFILGYPSYIHKEVFGQYCFIVSQNGVSLVALFAFCVSICFIIYVVDFCVYAEGNLHQLNMWMIILELVIVRVTFPPVTLMLVCCSMF